MQDKSERYPATNRSIAKAKRLGGYLIEAGLLTSDQVNVALNDQHSTGMRFGEIIVARGWVKEQTIEWVMEKVVIPEKRALQRKQQSTIPPTAAQSFHQQATHTIHQTVPQTTAQTNVQSNGRSNGQTSAQINAQGNVQSNVQSNAQLSGQINGQASGQAGGQASGQANRQASGQANRQAGGHTSNASSQTPRSAVIAQAVPSNSGAKRQSFPRIEIVFDQRSSPQVEIPPLHSSGTADDTHGENGSAHRRDVPISKPLPSVQSTDGDVSWVG